MSNIKHQISNVKYDVFAVTALVLLAIAFFWKMAFTDLILPRGDVFAYFYPYWQYRDAVLQTGRLPLWNPYLFMGAPFLANSQAGVFYPLNWPLMWLDTPSAIKAAIIFHVAWAAIGMVLFSRRTLSLSVLGATLAGAVLALSGYLTAQVEHINQLQGLAWLPWLFWLWDELIARKRRKVLLWLGAALAMQLLAGHSQSAFISGVGLGAWALWHAITCTPRPPTDEQEESKPLISRLAQPYQSFICVICGLNPEENKKHLLKLRLQLWPVGAMALAALLALGMAAVQILPTLELARLSNRGGGLPFDEALSFSLRPWLAGRALLPSYSSTPLFSEYVGYVGITALLLGLLGAWAGRRNRKSLALVMLAGLGLFLAMGAYNPVYWALVKVVPGFNLFRAPARWMVLWAFGAAGLAGTGLDALLGRLDAHMQPLRFTHLWRSGLVPIGLAALSFAAPLAADNVQGATRPGSTDLVLWAVTLCSACLLIWWTLRDSQNPQQVGSSALAILVLLELFLAARSLPYNHLSAPSAWSSQRPAISTLLAAQQGQTPPARFLSLSDIYFDPGDLHEIEANYEPYLVDDALYDLIVATKQKEVLTPNLPLAWGIPAMDGFDGGILPTRDYTRFTALFLDEEDVAPDGRLRENLQNVPDLHWLSLANVGWVITDKVFDAWIDHVYYDLQFPARRTGDTATPIEAYPDRPFVATAVGIIGHLEGADGLADGAQVGTIAIFPEGAAGGQDAVTLPLLVDASQPGGIGAMGSASPAPAGSFTSDEPDRLEYHTLVEMGSPENIEYVEITLTAGFPGTLAVRGISLIDQRSAAFASTTLSEGHTLRPANSGDVKIYEYRGALPRAYLACDVDVAGGTEAMWQHMKQSGAGGKTVIEDQNPLQRSSCDALNPGRTTITTYEPERVVIDVRANQSAYLVLSDAWYPAWEATVDGSPAEVLRANGLFRAVQVAEGEHQVTFTYRSRMLEIGAVMSALFWLSAIAGLVAVVKRSAVNTPL